MYCCVLDSVCIIIRYLKIIYINVLNLSLLNFCNIEPCISVFYMRSSSSHFIGIKLNAICISLVDSTPLNNTCRWSFLVYNTDEMS